MTKYQMINLWVDNALVKTKILNSISPSSYGLKHLCEESIGVYVSNEEIKAAMISKGFMVDDCNNLNWHFNISVKINKVIFSKKLGNNYDNKSRYYRGKDIFIDNV